MTHPDATERLCAYRACGSSFSPSKPWQRFCCDDHRKREHAASKADPGRPLPADGDIAVVGGVLYRLTKIGEIK